MLLHNRIVPKRELALRMSEDMQALNRSAFVQQQAAIADIYGMTQRQRLADARRGAHREPRHRRLRDAVRGPARGSHPPPAGRRRAQHARPAASLREADQRAGRRAARDRAGAARRSRAAADGDQGRARDRRARAIDASGGSRGVLDSAREPHRRRAPDGPRSLAAAASRRCSTTSGWRPRSIRTSRASGSATAVGDRAAAAAAWTSASRRKPRRRRIASCRKR